MKNILSVIGLVASTLVSGPIWAARGPRAVGIPQDRKVISVAAQKRFITQVLNKNEGRKQTWKQRKGELGSFTTVGGSERNWAVTGPDTRLSSSNGSHAGTIETVAKLPKGQGGTNRVTVFPLVY